MSYYLRRKLAGRDNIAVGSATGRENVAVGSAGSTAPIRVDNIAVGDTQPSTDIAEKFGNVGGGTTPLTGSSAYIVETPINTN